MDRITYKMHAIEAVVAEFRKWKMGTESELDQLFFTGPNSYKAVFGDSWSGKAADACNLASSKCSESLNDIMLIVENVAAKLRQAAEDMGILDDMLGKAM